MRFRIFTAVLLLLSCAGFAKATSFNLNSDWSDASNPNGVWSYNQGSIPLTAQQLNWGGVVTNSLSWTTTTSGTFPPAWSKSTNAPAGAFDWNDGDVVVHSKNFAQDSSDLANVTWTSPSDGVISIDGKAWDAEIFAGRDVSWNLYVNGVTYAQRSSTFGVMRSDAAASFDQNLLPGKALSNLSVSSGDVVKFEVASPLTFGHFVGVQLNIDLTATTNPVPLPAAAYSGILLLAALGLSRGWRTFRMGRVN